MSLLKFHGKFKDLVPAGWEFQKLFARNYRQYCIYPAGEWRDHIRVWQHHGGYVELNDFHGHSEAVIRYMVANGPVAVETPPMLNLKTGLVEAYNSEKHNNMMIYIILERQGADKETLRKAMSEFHDNYRRCNLEDKTVEYLKKMVDLGWIKI